MEVFLIILIAAIVFYVIYKSSPSTKFKEGVRLLDASHLVAAILVFESILEGHPDAAGKLAECKLKQGLEQQADRPENALIFYNQVLEIREKVSAKTNQNLIQLAELKAHLQIASINYDLFDKITDFDLKRESLQKNLLYIQVNSRNGSDSATEALRVKHQKSIADCYFELGKVKERINNLSEAVTQYYNAIDCTKTIEYKKIKAHSYARIGICLLKQGDIASTDIIAEIQLAPKELRKDFYYRMVVDLMKKKKYKKAEAIIAEQLNDTPKKMQAIFHSLKEFKKAKAKDEIIELNLKIDLVSKASVNVEKIENLYKELEAKIISLQDILPDVASKLSVLKPSLFNRLISKYMADDQYWDGFKLILNFESFANSPELLKNLGICAYGILKSNSLSNQNYQDVLSSWLTAVYCDSVLINSLEYTSWDDPYSFTLIDSVGSNFNFHKNLPSNINYQPVSENNISIGKTQSELISQFEALLEKNILNNKLSKEIKIFYQKEKDSILRIVASINENILFASPYFAKTYGLQDPILKALASHFKTKPQEHILEAGTNYIVDNEYTLLNDFAKAKNNLASIIEHIEASNLAALKTLNTSANRSLAAKFEGLAKRTENEIYNAIQRTLENNAPTSSFFEIMEIGISFSQSKDTLKRQYAKTVANYCIEKINADLMTNLKALVFMERAYIYAKNDSFICRNIVTLISRNLFELLNHPSKDGVELLQILDRLYAIRSAQFNNSAVEILLRDYNQLVRQIIPSTLGFYTTSLPNRSSANISSINVHAVIYNLRRFTI